MVAMFRSRRTRKAEVHFPATSWPHPQARLTVDLGGPSENKLPRDDNVKTKTVTSKPATFTKSSAVSANHCVKHC